MCAVCTGFLLHERLGQDALPAFEDTDVAAAVAAHVQGEDTCGGPPACWPRGGVRAGLGACSAVLRFISGDVGEPARPNSAADSTNSFAAEVFGHRDAAFAMVAQLPQQPNGKQVGRSPRPLSARVAIELLAASNGWFRFITDQPPELEPEADPTGSHKPGRMGAHTTASRAAAPRSPLFAVDKCVLMWSFDTDPAWGGRLQPMTMTGDYRDSQDAISGVFDQLATHVSTVNAAKIDGTLRAPYADTSDGDEMEGLATARPPLLLPGRYSTGAPWAGASDDEDDYVYEKPRRPHENTCSRRGDSFGIQVDVDGTVSVFGPEGDIALERLLDKMVPPPEDGASDDEDDS
jgi:hypothetical protein